MNVIDHINYITSFYQVLNLVYEITEDGTYVSEHVGVGKDYIFIHFCNLCMDLVM